MKLFESNPFNLIEFGTRRRRSFEWQEEVISNLNNFRLTHTNWKYIAGTSNVYFSHKYMLPVIGTMAHEWLCAGQALFHPLDSQKKMLEIWNKDFNGSLGIALSDTLGTKKFISDFCGALAKAYDGVRHDSGDPIEWLEKILSMYNSCGINAKTKKVVFSDSLSIQKA